jgi:hypothetical protein
MVKAQSAVVARVDVQPRPQLPLRPPEPPATTLQPRREPRTAERIKDALLQWLDEEA